MYRSPRNFNSLTFIPGIKPIIIQSRKKRDRKGWGECAENDRIEWGCYLASLFLIPVSGSPISANEPFTHVLSSSEYYFITQALKSNSLIFAC